MLSVWLRDGLGLLFGLTSGFGFGAGAGIFIFGPEIRGAGMLMSGALIDGSAMSPGSIARAEMDRHESRVADNIMLPNLIILLAFTLR